MKPNRKHWKALTRHQEAEQHETQQYRAPNYGITTKEELDYFLVSNSKFEDRINRTKRSLNKREYFNKIKQADDPEKQVVKLGRKARAAKIIASTKLFGIGESVDVTPDTDCNISGW